VLQASEAIAEAHTLGIIHRDLMPAYLFLTTRPDGAPWVKVLDFGISKVGNGPSTLTRTGMVMGTPAYMPPEQARGSHVDHRVDIYAVGAILYRALTGSKPYNDADPVATLTAVIADEPRRPSTIERSIPPGLELVIQRAMAKDPAERYGSLAELELALAEFDPRALGTAETAAGSDAPATIAAAETLIADSSLRAGSSPGSDANLAASARPRLVLAAIGATAWLLASLIDAIASAVRVLSGTQELTASELALSTVGAFALLIAPGVYGLRYLALRVWPITPRVVETGLRLRRALLASLAAYAVIALGSRVLATFALLGSTLTLSPGTSLLAFALSLACAVFAWLFPQAKKRS
jgi:serine/threonine-protein kinase